MKQTIEVLRQVNEITGSTDKENFLRANGTTEVKYLLNLAFNPYLVFGIKDFRLLKKSEKLIDFDSLQRLVRVLEGGEVRGNKLKDLIEDTLSSDDLTSNVYLEAIFKKNLTIGLATKSINSVFPGLIPTFDVGLCDKFSELYFSTVKRWAIQPKFDGLRSICTVDAQGGCTFRSRNGMPQAGHAHISEEIKLLGFKNVVFDGELLASSWNETSEIVRALVNEKSTSKNLKYYVFDMVSMAEWSVKRSSLAYSERMAGWDFGSSKYLIKVGYEVVNGLAEAVSKYEQLFASGFEGGVLKNLDSKYPFKRTRDWMKMKNEETYDVTIKSYVEGEGRLVGKLGKFICLLDGVEIGVGGGYTDEQREDFWQYKDSMIGKTIEVKCQEKTKDGSLRFPIFLRVREDK